MNMLLDLFRIPGKKPFPTIKVVFLLAGVIFTGTIAWILLTSICSHLNSIPNFWASVRSFTAPPYLFIAVNLIILTIWKLSENRSLPNDRRSEEEIIRIPDIVYPQPKDLVSFETLHLTRKTSPLDFDKIPSNPVGNVILLGPAVEESSPHLESESSCVTVESNEASTASSRDILIQESELTIVNPDGKNEKTEDEEGEHDSLDATWNAIMKKGIRLERSFPPPNLPAVRAPASVVRRNNALMDGNDEINQRFEDFIKKNYDQIRLRKPRESIQPFRIK